ncbi:MAG: SRPBCC family protein [Solirubrobacterales bacterium]
MDNQNTAEAISVELTIAAPVDRVWRAITDPSEIDRWHGWDYEDLTEEIDEMFGSGATADSRARTLDTGDGRFELSEAGSGTRLRVVRERGGERDALDQGWHTFVQQLRFYLERHPGDERRTLYLGGLNVDSEGGSALALADQLGAGAKELFRTDDQLGLAIQGWGDGLLILSDNWMHHRTHIAAIASLYGVPPERFIEIAEWWRLRFYEAFEPIEDVQSEL